MRMSSVSSQPRRRRLPNRRPSVTEAIEVGGQVVVVTVGFDPEDDSPRELFLKAGKEGSLLNALLDDAGRPPRACARVSAHLSPPVTRPPAV